MMMIVVHFKRQLTSYNTVVYDCGHTNGRFTIPIALESGDNEWKHHPQQALMEVHVQDVG